MTDTLLVQFAGWCLVRLATDPDPTDEPRGVSGYTFAFAGEPDLDRVLHLQPPPDFTLRSYSPTVGVSVRQAFRTDGAATTSVPALVGARVELLDQPRLENRNWTLTLPGFEPIVPFHLRVGGDGLVLYREAPIDPKNPEKPLWEIDEADLVAFGASGMQSEPDTVGRATGIWDSLQAATTRLAHLRQDLRDMEQHHGDEIAMTALRGRIAELEYAVANPTDRRIVARDFVERFGFPLAGPATIQGDQASLLGGTLDTKQPWQIYFWIGGWDPDLLCAFMEGTLEIPYRSTGTDLIQ